MTDKADLFHTYWSTLAPDAPQPEREYRFALPRKFRFDFCWHHAQLAVEIDGGRFAPMGGRHAGDVDKLKLNIAVLKGWRVLRYSPQMIEEDPLRCVNEVLTALGMEELAL
jgi:very-short-patch-repair endonuclease